MMTIKELIKELEKVEDKSKPIIIEVTVEGWLHLKALDYIEKETNTFVCKSVDAELLLKLLS